MQGLLAGAELRSSSNPQRMPLDVDFLDTSSLFLIHQDGLAEVESAIRLMVTYVNGAVDSMIPVALKARKSLQDFRWDRMCWGAWGSDEVQRLVRH